MEQEQQQLKGLIVKAFTQIGDYLGDRLYDEEVMLINNRVYQNTNVGMHNDRITKELDLILVESYEELLVKIMLCLKNRD